MKENSDRKIYDKIVKYTDLTRKNILEIGCGDGRISSLLAVDSESLIAVDPDEKNIRWAKKHIAGVDFRIGSGENLNFPDGSFDIVIFTLSLHHQNSQKAISEAARVLKKGGNILVIEPVIEGEIQKVFAFVHNENNEKREAQKSITDSGLSVVDSDIFTAVWTFKNKADLLQSVFQYFDLSFDSDIALKITDFLGPKMQSKPIVLIDTMIIQSLSRTD